jgi:hypothetical protein
MVGINVLYIVVLKHVFIRWGKDGQAEKMRERTEITDR